MKKIIICIIMTVLLSSTAWAVDCTQLRTKQAVINQLQKDVGGYLQNELIKNDQFKKENAIMQHNAVAFGHYIQDKGKFRITRNCFGWLDTEEIKGVCKKNGKITDKELVLDLFGFLEQNAGELSFYDAVLSMTIGGAIDYHWKNDLETVARKLKSNPSDLEMSVYSCFYFGLDKSDVKETANRVLHYDDDEASNNNGKHRPRNAWYWVTKVKIPYNEKDFVEAPKPTNKPAVTCTMPAMGSGYTTDNSTGVEYTCIDGRIFFRNVASLPLDFNILTQMARKNKDTYLTESFSVKTLPSFLSWMVHDSGIYLGDGEQAASQVARDIASLLSKGNYKSIYNQYKQFIDELLKKN